MLVSDLDGLRCVDCGGALALKVPMSADEVIVDAVVNCLGCGRHYPILDTVGIFFRREDLSDFLHPREVNEIKRRGWESCLEASASTKDNRAQVAVMENWAYQWEEVARSWEQKDFEGGGYLGEEAFWSFIPISPDRISGRRVLVCAGGLGREAFHLSKVGPSKILVNEIGVEIYRIPGLIPDAGRKLILLRSDMNALPVPPAGVDVTVCDHALQHVPNHRDAFHRLCEVTAPDGLVAICVYSHEHNWVMTEIIEPMKGLVHRFPLKGQRAIALPFALAVFAVIHGLYRPLAALARDVATRLPLFKHMMMWSRQPFSLVWLQCFDLIHAPVSYHFRRAEMDSLAAKEGLEVVTLTNTNHTLWSLVGRRPK